MCQTVQKWLGTVAGALRVVSKGFDHRWRQDWVFAVQIGRDETFGNERSKTSKSDDDLFDLFDPLKRCGLLSALVQLLVDLAWVLAKDRYRCSPLGHKVMILTWVTLKFSTTTNRWFELRQKKGPISTELGNSFVGVGQSDWGHRGNTWLACLKGATKASFYRRRVNNCSGRWTCADISFLLFIIT